MTAPITPPTNTAAPDVPDRADRSTFSVRATNFFTYVKTTMWVDMAAFVTNAYANAVIAYDSAVTAVASALSATNSASAAAASAASVGIAWVSGTNYEIGAMRYSPITFATYRRKTAGAGTTDPSLDPTNWGPSVPVTGSGGTAAITGNVTLTFASDAAMTVNPTAPGLYVTLPDATTCTEGSVLFSIYNAGDHDYGVKNSAGTVLGWVRPKAFALIGLTDNSTSAGSWAYGLEKLGITAQYLNSTVTGMSLTLRLIALDANRTCFLFGGTTVYAIVYDASTQTWGAATSVRASISSGAFVGVKTATDKVMVVSCDTTTGLEAIILTISGTGVTPETATKDAEVLAGNFSAIGQLVAVTAASSFVVSYGRATNVSAIRAISLTNSVTPNIGAESALTPATTTPAILFVSGSIVRTVSIVSGASGLSCNPFTVSTNTLAAGTAASATTTSTVWRVFQTAAGYIVAQYINSTHYASVFTLTGTVEAVSSASLGTVPSNIITATDYCVLTSTKIVFLSHAGSTTWYANILSISAGTASAGTEISGVTYGNMSTQAWIGTTGNSVRFVVRTNNTLLNMQFDCSGTSAVLSSIQRMMFDSTLSVAAPSASDIYGNKSTKTLIATGAGYVIGGNSTLGDLRCTPGSVQRLSPVMAGITTSGVAGAANSESYIGNVYDNNATGYFIQKIEAAA